MTPEELAALHARCFTTPRPWSAKEFESLLGSKGVFLCTSPGGFLMGRAAGPEAELLTLAVDPDKRRQGIASTLVAAFESTARQQGAVDLFLEVAADNAAAIALYQAHGFKKAGIRKDYYAAPNGQHVEAFVLKKSISAN